MRRITYESLNSRQQENYNFQKVSAVLADYGFVTMRLSDDWRGADFIAQHVDGETFLKIQLKGRLTILKQYVGRGLHIAFREGSAWYLFPHDEILERILNNTNVAATSSWQIAGGYSFPRLSAKLKSILESYRILPFQEGVQ